MKMGETHWMVKLIFSETRTCEWSSEKPLLFETVKREASLKFGIPFELTRVVINGHEVGTDEEFKDPLIFENISYNK